MYLVPNIHPGSGSAGVPTVQANFAGSLDDWTTLSSVSSMPTGGAVSRAGNAMLYDSTGKLTYAPNNLLLNTATLSTQSVTTAAINYILSFKGTGSVALSGAYSGSLAGTGAANRVSLAFTSTAASLTLTVTGTVTEAQLEAVTYQTTPSTYVATTASAYYGPRFDYDPSTLAAKGLLVEGARTNLLNFSQSFATSGGAQNNWADTNITRNSTNNTSPDGTGNALRVTASAANGTIISSAAIGTSAQRVLSVWLRRVTGTGNIQYTLDNGSNWTTQAITSTWARYSFAATTANQQAGFRIVTSGDAIEIWGVQLEAATFSSSYVFTGSSTVARAAETFSLTGYTNRLVEAFYIDEQTNVASSYNVNASSTSPLTIINTGTTTTYGWGWLTSLRAYTNAYAGDIATPSWLSFSRTGNAMYYDSTGALTWAPSNMLLNSATLATQSVTTAAINYVLSFKGTGSVALSGAYSGSLAGTGASTRVSLAFTSTVASLTLTVTGTVTEAQLEPVTYQTSPRAYIPTTSAAVYQPRYDYDPSTTPATPRGLLIEESRQNLLTYSEQFDNAAYTTSALNISGSPAWINVATAPNGTNTADKITEDTTNSQHNIQQTYSSWTSGVTYTASVYVRAAGRNILGIVFPNAAYGAWKYVSFNLTTGATITVDSGVTATIVNVGNGWYRCSAACAATANASGSIAFKIQTVGTSQSESYAGDGVSGLFIWGAQLEVGSFPTSYISTTTGAVTRAADVAQLTGSALTTATGTQASIIVEGSTAYATGPSALYAVSDGTINNYYNYYLFSGGSTLEIRSAGAYQAMTPSGTIASNTTFRVAEGVKANDFAASVSGGNVVTNTSSAMPVGANTGYVGANFNGTNRLNGYVRSLALYNTRLPDAILKQKSTVGVPY